MDIVQRRKDFFGCRDAAGDDRSLRGASACMRPRPKPFDVRRKNDDRSVSDELIHPRGSIVPDRRIVRFAWRAVSPPMTTKFNRWESLSEILAGRFRALMRKVVAE